MKFVLLLAFLTSCSTLCQDNPNNMSCMSAEKIERELGKRV